jgi:hypothetical protein
LSSAPTAAGRSATLDRMADAVEAPLDQQLEEIGTQLAWVRDYL